MPATTIHLTHLCKTYRVPERESGMGAALGSLFKRRMREVPAVDDLTFDLASGEMVGFLGPNGAGKTTTLKMLSGLLHPTAGECQVLGCTPWKRERAMLRPALLPAHSPPTSQNPFSSYTTPSMPGCGS
jgi:ABC-2 type transport system ATP-binding protein